MKFINDDHQNLTKAQTSDIANQLSKLSFDNRAGIIAAALFSGIVCSAFAWQGTLSPRVYFCLKSPNGEICADKNNRTFRMTPYHWEQWGQSGRSKLIILKRFEMPTNPVKPFQAGIGFVSFALAGWMFRQLQFNEKQKSKWDGLADSQGLAIAELSGQIELMEVARDLELSATDNSVIIQQAELLGEVEIKLTQMEVAETLFEAETAGMSEEQKTAYVNFIRNQKTPYLSGTQTLDKTVDPRDKIDGEELPVIGNWFDAAIDYHCLLIWGGQGSGKTTLAGYIIKARKESGHRVLVFDPHAAKNQWDGLEVVGDGMNYQAIDDCMKWYFEECIRRYKLLRSDGIEAVKQLGKVTIVAEEMTNYTDRCKHSSEFVKACLSDNRKIYLNVIFISHGRTLETLGNSKGMAKTRDDSFFEVHCISPTKESKRRWEIKYPGGDFSPIPVPEWKTIFDFGETAAGLWRNERNERIPGISGDKERRFGRFGMSRNEILEEIDRYRNEMKFSQTQIIRILWGAKPGDNDAYRNAVSEYKELMGNE